MAWVPLRAGHGPLVRPSLQRGCRAPSACSLFRVVTTTRGVHGVPMPSVGNTTRTLWRGISDRGGAPAGLWAAHSTRTAMSTAGAMVAPLSHAAWKRGVTTGRALVYRVARGSRRLAAGVASGSRVPVGPGPIGWQDAMHVVGGVSLLVVIEQLLGIGLEATGCGSCPTSVVGILGIGLVATASPSAGTRLFQILGPASVWMKAALPLLLVPPIAAPLTAELPASVWGAVGVAWGALLLTTILTGRLAMAGGRLFPAGGRASRAASASTTRAGVGEATTALSPAMQRHTHAAAAAIKSPRLAVAALVGGAAASALLWRHTEPEKRDCWTAAPALVGLTTGLYTAAAWIPPSIGRVLPPTVCSGLGIVALVCATGWARSNHVRGHHDDDAAPSAMQAIRAEASLYMDGAGTALMAPVPATLITLGLLAHTHRTLLRQRLGAVALATVVGAPVAFVGSAWVGSRCLQAPAAEVASMIPGTTTTGLALTMHGEAHPLARPEWLALGPTVCGLSGMVAWPGILMLGGLSAAPPWVRGFAIGSASHVAGMAALTAAGETAAAEWAALAFFLFGTYRCVLLQLPPYRTVVSWACGGPTEQEIGS
eukprot:m.37304 g.37304  ORF g.37304 m.37304 type:complete len:598 (-) comp5513_c0_seq2:120-1913(-)